MSGPDTVDGWHCPVCGGTAAFARFAAPAGALDAATFRPSAAHFGRINGAVVCCPACSHGTLSPLPAAEELVAAYAAAEDPVSLREEEGQVATAHRALADVERVVERVVERGLAVDLGCWTGSFLVAARERGWETAGVEPSEWASARARARGLDVRTAELADHGLPEGRARLVVMADVLEHLADPRRAVQVAASLLEPGGVLFATVPDAGSLPARALGRHWWSVLPMHVQYFTRASLRRLLDGSGFSVRSLRTHPKSFTARYYAERLADRAPALTTVALRALEWAGWADRVVTPDLRDRVAAIAVRRP